MKKGFTIALAIAWCLAWQVNAQNNQAPGISKDNPFASIGVDEPVLGVNGYAEMPSDSLLVIAGWVYNKHTGSVVDKKVTDPNDTLYQLFGNQQLYRWLSVDPVVHPYQSPYNSFDNNPVWYIDIQGAYKYPANKAEDYSKRYPMITKYLSTLVQQDISKSTTIQNVIIKNTWSNPNVTKEQLINKVAAWNQDGTLTIEFREDLTIANAYTVDGSGFQINAAYADHVEAVLSDPNATEEDKTAALTRFYQTILDETTIALNMQGNGNRSEEKNGLDPGDVVVQELYFEETVNTSDGEVKVLDPTGIDNGMGDFSETKYVVNRKKELGESDLLPTVPEKE